ncbi:zinc-ribbon domain-containing protein [Gemmatimonas phototrophica]|uniref:zinc-ribbon domain-containing protein n=1 Tax=Gemmatimonas phototrophica TaxID=1379270 RepID=UPI0009465B03|nr:zinc-ribbon domain-containing protein [Gemmatimonas phototrophica]
MTPPNPSAGAGFCAACGAALSAGARFCHRCGTPLGQGLPVAQKAAQPGGVAAVLPWGVAFVALLALIAMVAGKNFGAAKGSAVDGSANSLPTQAIDGQGAPAGAPFAGGAGGAGAPNIANLSPSERANRLYTRIMEYAEFGKVDSVAFFAPMALASHEMLESPTADERYHFGRIAEVTNNPAVAKAQADTILQGQPENLLGLLLAARAARMTQDNATAKGFDQRLLKVLAAQLATQLEDYQVHRAEIDRAVADAQK